MATYEEGYKRAVEDTIREIQENLPLSGVADPVYVLNEIPRFIRKKLLTKKVTKWVRVFRNKTETFPAAAFFDSKAEADDHNGTEYAGAYPIEIEVPL